MKWNKSGRIWRLFHVVVVVVVAVVVVVTVTTTIDVKRRQSESEPFNFRLGRLSSKIWRHTQTHIHANQLKPRKRDQYAAVAAVKSFFVFRKSVWWCSGERGERETGFLCCRDEGSLTREFPLFWSRPVACEFYMIFIFSLFSISCLLYFWDDKKLEHLLFDHLMKKG